MIKSFLFNCELQRRFISSTIGDLKVASGYCASSIRCEIPDISLYGGIIDPLSICFKLFRMVKRFTMSNLFFETLILIAFCRRSEKSRPNFPLLNYLYSVFQTKVKFKNIIENICENIKNQLILKPYDLNIIIRDNKFDITNINNVFMDDDEQEIEIDWHLKIKFKKNVYDGIVKYIGSEEKCERETRKAKKNLTEIETIRQETGNADLTSGFLMTTVNPRKKNEVNYKVTRAYNKRKAPDKEPPIAKKPKKSNSIAHQTT
ncbi:hypothetical protein BpHYR1_003412 [Brachionus plicatilis]|uniref:Uncharacterized protein n=1 Tax=Brachionus plicatilis TaxID=10195 RepID=A0A3M7RCF1_BRAPC|nr:hypothetical protein BpHYR1_003412 [Brachionus plicatilis]